MIIKTILVSTKRQQVIGLVEHEVQVGCKRCGKQIIEWTTNDSDPLPMPGARAIMNVDKPIASLEFYCGDCIRESDLGEVK